jgi:hypothetical protein
VIPQNGLSFPRLGPFTLADTAMDIANTKRGELLRRLDGKSESSSGHPEWPTNVVATASFLGAKPFEPKKPENAVKLNGLSPAH